MCLYYQSRFVFPATVLVCLIVGMILAQITVVVCQDTAKVNLLLDKSPRCLRKIIAMKEVNLQTVQRAKNRGVDILRYEEVEELGAGKSHAEVVCWTVPKHN